MIRDDFLDKQIKGRIILVGQAPGRGGDPRRPLIGGVTGTRLQELAGLDFKEYVRRFHRCNVLDYYPGPAGRKGDAFPMMEARIEARVMMPLMAGRTVVFVGLAVAEAFGEIKPEPYSWRLVGDAGVGYFRGAAIPHPSPVNRYWNDEANVARAKSFFYDLLGRTGGHT